MIIFFFGIKVHKMIYLLYEILFLSLGRPSISPIMIMILKIIDMKYFSYTIVKN